MGKTMPCQLAFYHRHGLPKTATPELRAEYAAWLEKGGNEVADEDPRMADAQHERDTYERGRWEALRDVVSCLESQYHEELTGLTANSVAARQVLSRIVAENEAKLKKKREARRG